MVNLAQLQKTLVVPVPVPKIPAPVELAKPINKPVVHRPPINLAGLQKKASAIAAPVMSIKDVTEAGNPLGGIPVIFGLTLLLAFDPIITGFLWGSFVVSALLYTRNKFSVKSDGSVKPAGGLTGSNFIVAIIAVFVTILIRHPVTAVLWPLFAAVMILSKGTLYRRVI